jgi:DNA-binding NtrC family response regulator
MPAPPPAARSSNRARHGTGGSAFVPPAESAYAPVALTKDERSSIEVLIVDDEHSLRESCASLLNAEGFQVTVLGRGSEALDLVKRRRFDILLLDLYMAQVSGVEIMRAALHAFPDTLAIVMTGNPSVESSVAVLQEGAWDYLPKPFSATHFQVLIGRASHAVIVARESRKEKEQARRDGNGLGTDPTEIGRDRFLMGGSEAFRKLVDTARMVASTDASVFLTGESGSGKDVIAHYIHAHSRRKTRPLISLNCAAIPEHLLESEMFGHVEGAFTGAVRAKPGLLEVANGGVLFLDELTEMPVPIQAKLLRVIQDGVVRRVGSTKTDAVVNVRFIAATNRDPVAAVRAGELRKDLFYRLRVVPLRVPPLRERREDIPVMAAHFLEHFWLLHREQGSEMPTFSEGALKSLVAAPWHGNVRELRNVIEHMVVLAEPGAEIQPEQIPFMDDLAMEETADTVISSSILGLDYHTARERVLADFESAYIRHVVAASDGNISDAARLAQVDRTTLYRLMEKHGTRRLELLRDDESDAGAVH